MPDPELEKPDPPPPPVLKPDDGAVVSLPKPGAPQGRKSGEADEDRWWCWCVTPPGSRVGNDKWEIKGWGAAKPRPAGSWGNQGARMGGLEWSAAAA